MHSRASASEMEPDEAPAGPDEQPDQPPDRGPPRRAVRVHAGEGEDGLRDHVDGRRHLPDRARRRRLRRVDVHLDAGAQRDDDVLAGHPSASFFIRASPRAHAQSRRADPAATNFHPRAE